jgi:hypothetical protein
MTTGKTRSARRAAKANRNIVAEGPAAPVKSAEKGGEELVRQTRGSIFVEYLALLCLVTLGGSAALVSLGAPLVHYYRVTQLVLGLPVP